ncbi:carboxymuconolactone decarboxylase family protein [Cellulosimicrobium cellulans]|uniref:carboxymuconolactone decarboxylase family protein n=1 Tax=Cellulosimicrobium cellulans TaxID=1710 RepID=UPI001EDC76F8|nr:carboxymuconolactone decarboxylase family protein [Cellulosimicrobium cellulans]UKJ65241.1 carboxymuconolactone decarboxylase family protein [Cellulosimicrobium cellulans]
MARISLDPPRTLLNRTLAALSRRRYGAVLEPLAAVGHHPRVATTYCILEAGVARWRALDPTLSALAVMATAVRIGCSWCVDFGYWESEHGDVDARKLHDVPAWRESDAYTVVERRVLEYAEAATATPPTVTDELAAALVGDLGEPAFVELTAVVALENLRSRINAALGLSSQGFSDRCEIPLAGGLRTAGTAGRLAG